MPRGNLETIFPRAMVLAGVKVAVEERNYRAAFLICRKHRVDLNILHDLNSQKFLEDVGLYIDQLKSVEFIDLLLSNLK